MGHYSFISKLEEIEKKVIQALSKDYLDYLKIHKINLLDKKKKVACSIEDGGDISYGEFFN